MPDDEFRENMRESVAKYLEDSSVRSGRLEPGSPRAIYYMAGDIGDPASFTNLAARLKQIEDSRHTAGNVLFYLSTQPSQYAAAAKGIGAAGLAKGNGWRRIVIEKPFGHDLASARELSDKLHEVFRGVAMFIASTTTWARRRCRIFWRFGSAMGFSSLSGTGDTSITCRSRQRNRSAWRAAAAYYQEAGALRDMIQNHLLQIMATIAMEPSATFSAGRVRDERVEAATVDPHHEAG